MSRCLYMAKWKLNCWIVPSPERPIFTSFLLCWQKKRWKENRTRKIQNKKEESVSLDMPYSRRECPCHISMSRCANVQVRWPLPQSPTLHQTTHTHTSHKTETIFDHLLNVLNIRRAILPRCWPKFSVRRAATRRQNKHGRVCVFYSQPSHPLWMNEWAAKRLVVCDPAEWCYASKSFSLKRK